MLKVANQLILDFRTQGRPVWRTVKKKRQSARNRAVRWFTKNCFLPDSALYNTSIVIVIWNSHVVRAFRLVHDCSHEKLPPEIYQCVIITLRCILLLRGSYKVQNVCKNSWERAKRYVKPVLSLFTTWYGIGSFWGSLYSPSDFWWRKKIKNIGVSSL